MTTPERAADIAQPFKYSLKDRQRVADAFRDSDNTITSQGKQALRLLKEVETELGTPGTLFSPNEVTLFVWGTADTDNEVLKRALHAATNLETLYLCSSLPGIIFNVPANDVPQFAIDKLKNNKVKWIDVAITNLP